MQISTTISYPDKIALEYWKEKDPSKIKPELRQYLTPEERKQFYGPENPNPESANDMKLPKPR